MWETIRALLSKASLPMVLIAVATLLVAAAGGVTVGPVQFNIAEMGFRVALGAVAVFLIAFGLYSEIQSGWRTAIDAVARDVTALRADLISFTPLLTGDTIKPQLESINVKLDLAVKSILGEVRKQQRDFSRTIQERFEEQSTEASRALEAAVRRELDRFASQPTSRDRDQLATQFAELTLHAIRQMGQFQRTNIEQQSVVSLESVERQVSTAILDVAADVKDLKTRVESFALALPPSSLSAVAQGTRAPG